jgi:hypothetical protein
VPKAGRLVFILKHEVLQLVTEGFLCPTGDEQGIDVIVSPGLAVQVGQNRVGDVSQSNVLLEKCIFFDTLWYLWHTSIESDNRRLGRAKVRSGLFFHVSQSGLYLLYSLFIEHVGLDLTGFLATHWSVVVIRAGDESRPQPSTEVVIRPTDVLVDKLLGPTMWRGAEAGECNPESRAHVSTYSWV